MKFNLFLASAVASVAVVSSSHADFTSVTYLGLGYSQSITVVSAGYNGVLDSGQLYINLSGSSGASGYLDGNHTVFCADIYELIVAGPSFYDIVSVDSIPDNDPMGAGAAQGVADIYAFAAGAQYGTDADLACAFQVALWEVINDFGSLDTTAGSFQASGLTAAAQAYTNLLLSAVGSNGSANLVGLTNGDLQDLIVEVPAPGALALLGLAGLRG